MKNMKVKRKLIVSFLITVALAVIIGIVGLYGIITLDEVSNMMYVDKAKPLGDLATATEYFQRLRVQTRNAIIYTGNTEQLRTVESDMNQRAEQFKTSMKTYEPSIVTENGKRLYDEIMTQYTNVFEPGVFDVLDGAKQGKPVDVLVADMAATTAAANIIADDLAGLTEARMEVMSDANDESTKLGGTLLAAIIVVIIIASAASVILALYIAGLISKPLVALTGFMNRAGTTGDIMVTESDTKILQDFGQLRDEIGMCIGATASFINHLISISEKLELVANGDLTVEVKLLSERDTMGISLQKMADGLNKMFNEINSSTDQVSAGSKQIADGAQSLAQGSTEQAASVQQLSSSIAQIAEKTKTNAEMAGRAALLANTIMSNAETGSRQMGEMMEAVKEINAASQGINKVIKVIDDIAFQTNILALNAAVEAARAGQHGKGFAVVAEEVRNLAAKSAEAAKETGSMIANSMEKAELGSRIADETAVSLNEIVMGINESTQLVSQIAESSEEQSTGISEINRGIDQVAQVVQQNSATAEQSAAASEEMSGQAAMLENLIAQFKLKDQGSNYYKGINSAPHSQNKQYSIPAGTGQHSNYKSGEYGKY